MSMYGMGSMQVDPETGQIFDSVTLSPIDYPSGGSSGGSNVDWNAIVAAIARTGNTIVQSQFPPGAGMPPGSVVIQTPNGTQMVRYADGQMVPISGAVGGTTITAQGGSGMTTIIIVGVAALAIMMMGMRR